MKKLAGLTLLALACGTVLSSCEKEEVQQPSARWNKVWEYTPAPGQFINMEPTAGLHTPEEAAAAAEKILSAEGGLLSLGGFGGYLVVGFDHDVSNSGSWDLAIEGNSFQGSSEPGIVYVMKDENLNGQPDDIWYELKGSEYGKEETIRNYAVTYFRPEAAHQPVKWRDSEGKEGQIDHLPSFHSQEHYYPSWIKSNEYTLTGTCLKNRTVEENGTIVNKAFDWGYADNYAAGHEGDLLGSWRTNHFKISNAVKADGTPADLSHINFVKIQTGVNAKGPNIGEISTEIVDIQDFHLMK